MKQQSKVAKRWGAALLCAALMGFMGRMVWAQDEVPTEVPVETLTDIATDESSEPENTPTPSPEPTTIPVAATATDVPGLPAIITMTTNGTQFSQDSSFLLVFTGQNLSHAHGLTISCQADPSLLLGLQALPGILFDAQTDTIIDAGFQADGSWLFIVTSPVDLGAAGTLAYFNYQVVGYGTGSIQCQFQLTDANGQPLPLAANEASLSIQATQNLIVPTATTAAPLPIPTQAIVNPSISPTPVSTVVVPTAEPTTRLLGQMDASVPLAQTTVMVVGLTLQAAVELQADGSFDLDVPYGDYQVVVAASGYLPYVLNITATAPELVLPLITLNPIGSSNIIPAVAGPNVDVVLENFGMTVPPAPTSADLNGDQVVNIYDLVIASAGSNPGN